MASLIRTRPRKGGAGGRRRPDRRGGDLDGAQAHDYDAIVLDVMLPGIDGFETCRRLRGERRLGAGADADRARLGRGSRRRARHRRRRLPREAVRVRGAARSPACARPARRAPSGRACSRSATCGSIRPRARCGAAVARGRAVGEGVRAARDVHAPAGRGALAAAPARARLGLRRTTNRSNVVDVYVRRLRAQDRRAVRRGSSLETVRGAGYRLRGRPRREPRCRSGCGWPRRSRWRWRVVLAGTGWFLYSSLASHLAHALDRELRLRAQDLAALVSEPDALLASASNGRFVEHGESYAQLVDRERARRRATQPLGEGAGPDAGRAAAAPCAARDLREPKRQCRASTSRRGLLATPFTQRAHEVVLVVGATRENRAETLASLRDELLIAGPIALLARHAAPATSSRACRCARSSRCVGGRRRSRPRRRASGCRCPQTRRRGRAPRRDPERDARPARGGAGARARLRRRRGPRAADAACAPAHGARARAPACRLGGGAPRGRAALVGGGRPAGPARRGSAADRPLATGAVCRCGSSRSRPRTLLARVASRFEWRAQAASRPLSTSQPDGLQPPGRSG